jgi:hypothetical protein
MRPIWEIITGEILLTEQAMRKNILLCTKDTYMLKLFMGVVTVRIEATVIVLRNEFLYAYVK